MVSTQLCKVVILQKIIKLWLRTVYSQLFLLRWPADWLYWRWQSNFVKTKPNHEKRQNCEYDIIHDVINKIKKKRRQDDEKPFCLTSLGSIFVEITTHILEDKAFIQRLSCIFLFCFTGGEIFVRRLSIKSVCSFAWIFRFMAFFVVSVYCALANSCNYSLSFLY